jgi:hypothetical protein
VMVSMAVLQFRDTCGKRRNINLIIKRKLWELLNPSVQLHTPISILLCMASC